METVFYGDLWADNERAEVVDALDAVNAVKVVWSFSKFHRTDTGTIRYAMSRPGWIARMVFDSYSDLVCSINPPQWNKP